MNVHKIIDVVSKAASIVNDNSPFHVYRTIGLGIGDNGISAITTNGEITVQAWNTTRIHQRVAVLSRLFLEAAKTLQGDVQVELRDNQVYLTSDNAKFRLSVGDYDALPVPQDFGDQFAEVSGLAEVVRRVGSCADKERARNLDSIYFDGKNAVATDGFRMAVMQFAFPQPAIIPIEAMRNAARLLGDDPVRIAVSDGQVLFASPQMNIYTQTYQSNYINYQEIIQKVDTSCDKFLAINRADLLRSLRRAALFSTYVQMRIYNDANTVELTAEGELGSMTDKVYADADFEALLRFNADYLSSLLSSAGSSDVVFRIKDSHSPVGIDDQFGWRSVIMPAYIDSNAAQNPSVPANQVVGDADAEDVYVEYGEEDDYV